MKLVLLLLGVAGGATGATAWLLSEQPNPPNLPLSDTVRQRLDTVKSRWDAALAEGRRAGGETEARLRAELDTYRSRAKTAAR